MRKGVTESVCLLLFDPVRWYFVQRARYVDAGGFSAANIVMDVSRCRPLRRVLALYPHLPLPDFAFHAPLLPLYPCSEWCDVEEDATLGCHQGALYPPRARAKPWRAEQPRDADEDELARLLSFVRIKGFLDECGSPLVHGDALLERALGAERPLVQGCEEGRLASELRSALVKIDEKHADPVPLENYGDALHEFDFDSDKRLSIYEWRYVPWPRRAYHTDEGHERG